MIDWSDSREGVDWRELEALYRAAPLGNKNAVDLEIVFGNSMFCCFARDNGRLVGAGRVLADGRDCAYLCDVAVLPSHQGTGLGKQIIERLLAKSQGHAKIILYAVAGREPFYAKFGFLRMKTAMAIFRNRQSAIDKGLLAEG
ncbi:GNAT family N-acetyltransferase [Bradyrhizobium sp. WSM 1738]|uniref:GNAT family N-acetyltransferase n=1 Tax=Bradyrhizobium hereditatis TaxID=2821405 RepID=UPI001CE26296|nr:GNAT family N-acetyltransferase [Bradyrhizobium hereditatis]MCA6118455.1 GNAT family N-acetyltransferase [Bradyrhizobium hereditatis]